MGLSIIIPVYNAEKYLSKCLDSILVCKQKELEIILINDGSTDNSKEVCEKYQNLDIRVRVFSQKNQGVSAARNYGIEQATNQKIMFFDADDFFDITKWEIIWKYTISQDYDFVGFSYESYFEKNKNRIPEFYPFSEDTCSQKLKIKEILFGTPLLHTCWGKIFNLELIKKYHCSFPVGVPIGEDYIFVMDYLMKVDKPLLVNNSILYYRQNPDGAMRTFNFDIRKNGIQLIWKHCYQYLIKENNRGNLWEEFYYYQFRSYTKFLREIAGSHKFSQCLREYKQVFNDNCFRITIKEVSKSKIPFYKKLEYLMMRRKYLMLLVCYFKLKSRAGG